MRIVLLLCCLPVFLNGCSTTYNGSNSFYDEHPEYQQRPDYYNPTTGGDDMQNSSYFGIGNTRDDEK